MKYIISLIIVAPLIIAEVLIGFEAESRYLISKESVRVYDYRPHIKNYPWKLTTDHGRINKGYTLEFATIGGVKWDKIVQATNDMINVFEYLFKDINDKTNVWNSYPELKNLYQKLKSEYTNTINKVKALKVSDSTKTNKEVLREIIIQFIENYQLKNIEKGFEKDLDCYAFLIVLYNEADVSVDIIENTKNLLNHYSTSKDYYECLIKNLSSIIKASKASEIEEVKNKLLSNVESSKKGLQLLKVFQIVPSKVGFNFNAESKIDDMNIINPFTPYCFDKYVIDSEPNDTCDRSKLNFQLQVSFQVQLASIEVLLKLYSQFMNDQPNEDYLQIQKQWIPLKLIYISDCVVNPQSHCEIEEYLFEKHKYKEPNKFSNDGLQNIQIQLFMNQNQNRNINNTLNLWKNSRKVIFELIDLYKNTPEAIGLFYLVLIYTLTVFNSTDEWERQIQKTYLIYGPKRLAPIMSRIAFSEYYDNMTEDAKSNFNNLIKHMCGFDFIAIQPFMDNITWNTGNHCNDFKIPYYSLNVSKGNNHLNQASLNLHEWLLSIVTTDHDGKRLYNEQKIAVKENGSTIPVNDQNKISKYSDLLSPPPGYRYSKITKKSIPPEHIYSMGGLKKVRKNHAILEIRPYTSLNIHIDQIGSFTNDHVKYLYDMLQINDATFIVNMDKLHEKYTSGTQHII